MHDRLPPPPPDGAADPLPSLRLGPYRFKQATTATEFEQVHRLNHAIFAEEVAQHPRTATGALVDKFDHKNTYFIALDGEEVVGMVAVHDRPPFSVAEKLSDHSLLEVLGDRFLEVRLLGVAPRARRGLALPGLIGMLHAHAERHHFEHVLISAIREQLGMYRRLGFRALGPEVAAGRAHFTPMVLCLSRLAPEVRRFVNRLCFRLRGGTGAAPARRVCLLPGPVPLAPSVRAAFAEPPVSHRGAAFVERFEQVRRALGRLAGGKEVALFCGSGTLANDVVAATVAADRGRRRGLVLVNGEFGRRLVRHARRWRLPFETLRFPWGAPWDLGAVAAAMDAGTAITWVWAVHLESSTGLLNDLPGLLRCARPRGVRVYLDAVSSLGAVPLDLTDVTLASGTSGKSLGAAAGIAVVFADASFREAVRSRPAPPSLDLRGALRTLGPRFTFPSAPLAALEQALDLYATPARARARFDEYAALGRYVRSALRSVGIAPLAGEAHAAPVLITFRPPAGWTAERFRDHCLALGYELAGESTYLRRRGLLQIATMGHLAEADCAPLFEQLREVLPGAGPSRRDTPAEPLPVGGTT
jgi:aspartate aminotransferase-like enzyme